MENGIFDRINVATLFLGDGYTEMAITTRMLEDFQKKLFQQLSRAAVDKRSPLRNLIVATVADGTPRQRTLVLRRFERDPLRCLFYTDVRSDKLDDLQKNNRVSILGWHSKQRLQIRLSGTAHWENQTARCRDHWDALPVWGRKSYATELPPGTRIAAADDGLTELWREKPLPEHTEYAYPNFALLEVQIETMELLELARAGHRRAVWSADGTGSWVVP